MLLNMKKMHQSQLSKPIYYLAPETIVTVIYNVQKQINNSLENQK